MPFIGAASLYQDNLYEYKNANDTALPSTHTRTYPLKELAPKDGYINRPFGLLRHDLHILIHPRCVDNVVE
jgi:hypothetical protein